MLLYAQHRSKSGSGGARSVDDTVFVDAVSRRPRDPNPSVKRATDRMDTASTMTSKGRRTLRPSRKPAETYEPVTLSPGHKVTLAYSQTRTRTHCSALLHRNLIASDV